MAIREVTVEVTTKTIVKVSASNGIEAERKAANLALYGNEIPYYVNAEILDVQPINVKERK